MTAKEIKDKAILVLILDLLIPGLGHLIGYREIAEALKRTGKNPNADPEAIKKNGIIQLVLYLAGTITCGITSIVAWIWAFIIDTLMNYYGAMTSVPEEDQSSGG